MSSSTFMKPGNQSTVTEFILLGLSNDPRLQVPLVLLLLPVYIISIMGNISILVIVFFSAKLHTPMYFFLTQLSILDIIFSSTSTPKMLVDMLVEKKTITIYGCFTQVFMYGACAGTEGFLLAAMAFDRYVAICNPLLYTLSMTESFCIRLVVSIYIIGFLNSLIHATCLLRLFFCGPNVMNHFSCDYPTLLKLSCTDITINEVVRFVFVGFFVISFFLVIFVSYFYIVKAILRIRTTSGRHKAASTCISHFTCVFLFFGSCFFMELIPNSRSSEEEYKAMCVILTVVIPALNPLIYSLRNKDMKEGLRKMLHFPVYMH